MTAIAGAFNYIQQESVQFNNPVSESSLDAIGGSVNGLLSILLPVGSIVHSMLTEAQFQAQIGNTNWRLANGGSAAGTQYQVVTGFSTLPDLRGTFLRGKDNGRGLDPHGDLAVGTFESDQFDSHNHSYADPGHSHTTTYSGTGLTPKLRNNAYASGTAVSGTDATGSNDIVTNSSVTNITFVADGGSETNPKGVVVNILIRVN